MLTKKKIQQIIETLEKNTNVELNDFFQNDFIKEEKMKQAAADEKEADEKEKQAKKDDEEADEKEKQADDAKKHGNTDEANKLYADAKKLRENAERKFTAAAKLKEFSLAAKKAFDPDLNEAETKRKMAKADKAEADEKEAEADEKEAEADEKDDDEEAAKYKADAKKLKEQAAILRKNAKRKINDAEKLETFASYSAAEEEKINSKIDSFLENEFETIRKRFLDEAKNLKSFVAELEILKKNASDELKNDITDYSDKLYKRAEIIEKLSEHTNLDETSFEKLANGKITESISLQEEVNETLSKTALVENVFDGDILRKIAAIQEREAAFWKFSAENDITQAEIFKHISLTEDIEFDRLLVTEDDENEVEDEDNKDEEDSDNNKKLEKENKKLKEKNKQLQEDKTIVIESLRGVLEKARSTHTAEINQLKNELVRTQKGLINKVNIFLTNITEKLQQRIKEELAENIENQASDEKLAEIRKIVGIGNVDFSNKTIMYKNKIKGLEKELSDLTEQLEREKNDISDVLEEEVSDIQEKLNEKEEELNEKEQELFNYKKEKQNQIKKYEKVIKLFSLTANIPNGKKIRNKLANENNLTELSFSDIESLVSETKTTFDINEYSNKNQNYTKEENHDKKTNEKNQFVLEWDTERLRKLSGIDE